MVGRTRLWKWCCLSENGNLIWRIRDRMLLQRLCRMAINPAKWLYRDVPTTTTGQSAVMMWGPTPLHKLRKMPDTGVWNGHSYEDVPRMTMMVYNRIPSAVEMMRKYAMEALMDHMCRQSPHARRTRAAWSMTGRLSTKTWKGHFWSPSHLRWRSPQRSIIDPPIFRKYRLSHCFPSIAMNAASSEIRRLAYMSPVAVTISLGGSSWVGGTAGISFGMAD